MTVVDPAPQPSEAQVKAANDAELGRWQDDFKSEELAVPYKREEEDAEGADKKAEEKVEVEELTGVYNDPSPVITTEDPGDYTPADYSFEVTLKDGKTVKVNTPDEAEKLADDPDNFETPKQLMDFINKQNKMNRNLDRDHDKWESEKKTYDDQIATQQEREERVGNLVNGFEYLVSKGLLPAVDKADAVADWNDPEIAKHDGVKEQIALINYMTKENAQRERAGIPVLTSALDAYNAWKLEEGNKKEADEHKAAGEARKAAGARVAGVAPSNQGSYVPKGIAVGNPNVFKRGASVWDD